MSIVKGTCKYEGCDKPQASLGHRGTKVVKVYDKDGYLTHRILKRKTYYSSFCKEHQKAYNRYHVHF